MLVFWLRFLSCADKTTFWSRVTLFKIWLCLAFVGCIVFDKLELGRATWMKEMGVAATEYSLVLTVGFALILVVYIGLFRSDNGRQRSRRPSFGGENHRPANSEGETNRDIPS